MGFFQRLGALFGGKPPLAESRFLPIYVFSLRCREPIAGRLDLMNELSIADEGDAAWYARKVFHGSGKGRCFDAVEVELWLDAKRAVLRHSVTGGRWLSAEEYAQAVAEAEERAQAADETADEVRGEADSISKQNPEQES